MEVQNLPFSHLEALNFDLYEFFALFEGCILENQQIQRPENWQK